MKNIGRTAASGVLWMIISAFALKSIGFVGQLLLGWMLSPEDFGLIGLALSVQTFFELVQKAGIREILIRRLRRIDVWFNSALWLSLTIGIASSLLLLVAALIVSLILDESKLFTLILFLSFSLPLNAINATLRGLIESTIRFRFLAITNASANFLQWMLVIILASFDAGPYAFIAPIPIIAIFRMCLYAPSAKGLFKWRLEMRRWKYFLRDSATLVLTYIFASCVWQGDYFIIAMFQDTDQVGIYYFAFMLSTQSVILLGGSLATVLLPTFVRIENPEAQGEGFLRVDQTIAYVAFPACTLQALVAAPALEAIYGDKWQHAVPVLIVLSIGMAFRLVEWPSETLLKAQGRFVTLLKLYALHAMLMISTVLPMAAFGSGIHVAFAISFCLVCMTALRLHIAVKPCGMSLCDIVNCLWQPASMCLVGAICAMAPILLDGAGMPPLTQLITRCIVFVVAYLSLSLYFSKDVWRALIERLISKKSTDFASR